MSTVLPDRWKQIAAELVERTARIMAEAHQQSHGDHRKGWILSGAGLVVLLVFGTFAADRREAQGRSSVSFGRGTVISTESTGTGSRLADFSPLGKPRPDVTPAPATPSPSPSSSPAATRSPRATRSSPAPPSAGMTEVLISERDLLTALEESGAAERPGSTLQEGRGSAEVPARVPAVLNVGMRLPITLVHQVTTGSAGTIVSARLQADVTHEGRVIIPAGASLEGEAFATTGDDRVQVVFRALVSGGRTVPIQGVAFDAGGEQGLSGKVLKKGRGKAGLGRVLGSAARVASFGLVGGGDDFGTELAEELARGAARDAGELERRWNRSDKVIRVAGGTPAVVYLAADVRIQ